MPFPSPLFFISLSFPDHFLSTKITTSIMTSQSLTLYHPSPPSCVTSNPAKLSLSRLFSAETGTHLATELIYRILLAICQRFLNSFEAFAVRRLDDFSAFLERPKTDGSKIMEELEARESNGKGEGFACPLGGKGSGRWAEGGRKPPGPPRWVREAAERMRVANERGEDVYFGSEKAILFE